MSEEELAEAIGFTLKKSNKRNGFKVTPKYTRLSGAESEMIHVKTMAELADYIAERERLAEQRGEQRGYIYAIQLYIDTCEQEGVPPSWRNLRAFQAGQKQALQDLSSSD